MFSATDVAEVRHVVQRILVPCVFVIGLLGNSVSIYVLTRKRMRCTTNIYLTALAITDIIYLTMALLLSLQHYESVQRNCEYYWMHYGIMIWLCDACAYISIYIAVCFTIERFIAIRYPLKRQTFCTESLAKRVIAGVTLFCLLSTISTAFEHEYRIDTKLIDSHGRPCNLTLANVPKMLSTPQQEGEQPLDFNPVWQGSGGGAEEDHLWEPTQTPASKLASVKKRQASIEVATQYVKATATNIPSIPAELFALGNPDLLLDAQLPERLTSVAPTEGHEQKYAKRDKLLEAAELQPSGLGSLSSGTEYCQNVTFYQNTPSSLARHSLYMRIWYFFTTFVFVLIPLCVLGTFNCFLIMLVRRSKSLRGEMTNASSIRRPKRKSNISSVSQENRVTVTLIAVVLLFIVCQLPWAIYLIVSEFVEMEVALQAIIGNIFNFLAATNAAANFFLYCVLSDKYRKTVRQLITGYRYRRQWNTHTTNASLYTHSSAAINGSRRQRVTPTAPSAPASVR